MSEKDYVVEAQLRVPDGSIISAKPCYLITLTEKINKGKAEQQRRFIALDLPSMQPAYVQTKGFYTDASEEEIVQNFRSLLQSTNKDQVLELYLPWHSISHIRSLVFKHKTS